MLFKILQLTLYVLERNKIKYKPLLNVNLCKIFEKNKVQFKFTCTVPPSYTIYYTITSISIQKIVII